RPRDQLIGFVEQPLRRAPKGEVYGAPLLLVAERRKGLRFLESRPVVVINPEVEHVVRHHPEHQPVAKPVLPSMRRIVTRPSWASCSRRTSAKLSLATILRRPPSFR